MSGSLRSHSDKAVWTHIVNVLLGDEVNGPISKSLEECGYDNLQDLLALEELDITGLLYYERMSTEDGDSLTAQPLKMAHKNRIKAIIR